MTCPFETGEAEILLDYAAGRLAGAGDRARRDGRAPGDERAAALKQHIEHCRECAAFLVEQNAVWHALDLWEPSPISMDFNRRLWKRIDAAAEAPWYSGLLESLRYASWKPVIPLTAAILVIAGGFLLDHPGRKSVQPGVSLNEAQQVEQALDDVQLLGQLDQVALPKKPM